MGFKETIKFFKRYIIGEKRLLFKAMICILLSSMIGVSFGYLIGLAVDYTTNEKYILAVLTLILYFIFILIDNMYLNKTGKISMKNVCINIMEKINYQVFYKVGLLPARAFEEKSSGELLNRMTSDSSNVTETFRQFINIGTTFFSAFVIFIYILFNSWLIALEIILYFIIFYLYSKKYLPILKEVQKQITAEKDKAVAEANESIRGIREIRALGIRKTVNIKMKEIINNIFNKSKKQVKDEENYYATSYILSAMLEVTAFITCIILIALGKTTIGFFISITYYIYRFMGLIEWGMNFSGSYQRAKVSLERIAEIVDNKIYNDIYFGNVHKTDIEGNIEFRDVTFKYSEKEAYIFKNFNLKLEKNKKIALVGKSGQGKTSIFNLLLRYFEPNEGKILIDDIPINEFDEESFNQNIAIIRQEPFIFNKSIIDNFKIIDKYVSLKTIREYCKTAEIDDYIMSLPNKYNTLIGEGGVNLSGGQKQRLAIARALLKNTKIILFDEATSALDNENQEKIKNAIDNLIKNHTVIIVAHRLSTIIDSDIIYVIDNGKVVAHGKHKYLLKNCEVYKNLYKNENKN